MASLSQLSSDPRPMPYLAHVNKRGGAKGRRKTMYTKQIFLCHFALFVQGVRETSDAKKAPWKESLQGKLIALGSTKGERWPVRPSEGQAKFSNKI